MRKRKRKQTTINTIQNVGGYLLNPPMGCPYKKTFDKISIWTDLAICFSICQNQCDHYKWFKKANKYKRVQYLLDNGVAYSYLDKDGNEMKPNIKPKEQLPQQNTTTRRKRRRRRKS